MPEKKVLILVEGQTELGFTKRILASYFKGIAQIIPTMNTTKFVKSGPDFKGGITSYERVRKEIFKLLQDTSATIVTTMFDYYGLPSDFPRFDDQGGSCYERVEFLEKALNEDINDPRFFSYLQLHEFEALLFSAPQVIDGIMLGRPAKSNLQLARAAFHSPEEINNGPTTSPSHRIVAEYPEYEKVLHGQMISENIGIEALLGQCPHFSQWIERIRRSCISQPRIQSQANGLFSN